MTYLGQICVTLALSAFLLVFLFLFLFLVLFFLFLVRAATVFGNVTKLKVAFNVQDLQVLQPPEGAFYHRARGQFVKPGKPSTRESMPGAQPQGPTPTHPGR